MIRKLRCVFPGGILIISLLLLLGSCNPGASDSQMADIEVKRFEKDLFAISNYTMEDSIEWLSEKYPVFFPLFTTQVLEIGHPGQAGFADRLLAFKSDFTIYRAGKRVEDVFPDFSHYEQELESAFGRYAGYFPEKNIPEIITCISGFNQSIIAADSLLAISLDKYLGAEEDFYNLLYPPVPEYQRKNMAPEKITSDAVFAWVVTEFPFDKTKDNLMSNMVYQGRAVYALSQLMPELPDTLLWGYTREELEFLHTNELSMWEYLIEQQLLFITDKFRINQLVNPAPFTKDFSQDSPGQAVNWIGYQIVESYMNSNKDVSLKELMEETDYMKISNLARYDP